MMLLRMGAGDSHETCALPGELVRGPLATCSDVAGRTEMEQVAAVCILKEPRRNVMAFELRNGQGTLFENDKKGDNEKAPDFKGELRLGGKTIRIAMWLRIIKNGRSTGKPMYSIQVDRQDLEEEIQF